MSHYHSHQMKSNLNKRPKHSNLEKKESPSLHSRKSENSLSPDNQIQWDNVPEKLFFEKFEKVDKVMNERQFKAKQKSILKRVKTYDRHRAYSKLEGYRTKRKAHFAETKNFKLQSIGRILSYNYFYFILLLKKYITSF